MVENVDEIVRKLTKAQKRWLSSAVPWRFYLHDDSSLAVFAPSSTMRCLSDRSLVHPRTGRVLPLGLAVRALLNSLEGEGGGD